MSDLILVGRVVKPHGVKGEFSMKSFADSPFLFDEVDELLLAPEGRRPRAYAIEAIRPYKGLMLVKLEGVNDRDQAETLRGHLVHVPEQELPELEEGEFYLYEIEGFEVFDASGVQLGTVDGFLDGPQEIWIVKPESGEDILLPANDETVREVDMDAGRITVNPPEGLLDLYKTSREDGA